MLQFERSPGISVLHPGWDPAVSLPCVSSAQGLGRGICVGQWDWGGFPTAPGLKWPRKITKMTLVLVSQQPAQVEGQL